MFIANLITRCFVLVFDAPSYAINILVAKPMAVTATFFFFIHTLLKLNDKKFLIEPLVWAKTFLRLADADAFNLLFITTLCLIC